MSAMLEEESISVATSKGVVKIIPTEKPVQAGKKMQFIGKKPGKDEKIIIFGHKLKDRQRKKTEK